MWIWVLVAAALIVAVMIALNRRQSVPVSDERLEEFELRLSHEARVEIGTAITRHRKTLAIALYRKHTGADLATSRAAVDRWSRGIAP